jgi:hypothetical protein
MRVAYFIHDVTDPAVARRVKMLRAGGAEVRVVGFRRNDQPVTELEGAPVFDLGRTFDARLGHRAAAVARWTLMGRLGDMLDGCDVILARNLEMLALASAARWSETRRLPLVYECLDVHRIMFSTTAAGKAMRAAERGLLQQCQMLMVSSPAFLSGYFEPVQKIGQMKLQTLLVENKMLDLDGSMTLAAAEPRPAGPPWRIGWFGILRCRKSLNLLSALAARRPDLVRIDIRGRPSLAVFENLAAEIEDIPSMRFGGAYDPADLPQLYRSCHFVWAADFYDEGKNSALLIPNRIYDAGAHHTVPIALAEAETGRCLARRGLGVRVRDPLHELEAMFEAMTPEIYRRLEAASAAADPSFFRADQSDCEGLCAALSALPDQVRVSHVPAYRPKPFVPGAAGNALSR